jgi:hypothetical protein
LKKLKKIFVEEYNFLNKVPEEDLIFITKNYQISSKWHFYEIELKEKTIYGKPVFEYENIDGIQQAKDMVYFIDKKKLFNHDVKVYPFINNKL